MSKIDLAIPVLGNRFVDLRASIPGDCYTWSWERPLSEVEYLAIHHSAGDVAQTPVDIANFHINTNGWGGIGYHFLIDSKGVVFYVGDISTARANVANLNEKVIGICLIGNFTGNSIPTPQQLDSCKILCEFLLKYPGFNLKGQDSIKGHKELPGQSTICPGDRWNSWKERLLDSDSSYLESKVDNLQTSLAVVNQQRISLQEALQEREKELFNIKTQASDQKDETKKEDHTLTIASGLIKLYKLFFWPREASV